MRRTCDRFGKNVNESVNPESRWITAVSVVSSRRWALPWPPRSNRSDSVCVPSGRVIEPTFESSAHRLHRNTRNREQSTGYHSPYERRRRGPPSPDKGDQPPPLPRRDPWVSRPTNEETEIASWTSWLMMLHSAVRAVRRWPRCSLLIPYVVR